MKQPSNILAALCTAVFSENLALTQPAALRISAKSKANLATLDPTLEVCFWVHGSRKTIVIRLCHDRQHFLIDLARQNHIMLGEFTLSSYKP